MPISVEQPKGTFRCSLVTHNQAEFFARYSGNELLTNEPTVELSLMGNFSVSWEFADADLVEAIEFLEFVRVLLQKRKQEA